MSHERLRFRSIGGELRLDAPAMVTAANGKTAELAGAIHTTIDGRFRKSVRAMSYVLTHRT